MEVEKIVDALLEIKAQFPSMSNAEVLKVMELKILLEIRAKL